MFDSALWGAEQTRIRTTLNICRGLLNVAHNSAAKLLAIVATVAFCSTVLTVTDAQARVRFPSPAGQDAIMRYLIPAQMAPMRITLDRGGELPTYMRKVEQARITGQPIQITGQCMSACTLFLGTENVCVTRSARLGFHGPSNRGVPLSPVLFELWSQYMADHYPEPIRTWYLRDARHSIGPMAFVSGQELIRLGVSECATA